MKKTLGNKLNDLMTEKNITGKQLAADIQMTEGTISKILTGVNTNPKSDTIIALAKYFNVSSDYLLGLSDYKTPQAADIGATTRLSEKNIELLKGFSDNADINSLNIFNDFFMEILQSTFVEDMDFCRELLQDVYSADKRGNNKLPDDIWHIYCSQAYSFSVHLHDECIQQVTDILNKCVGYDKLKLQGIERRNWETSINLLDNYGSQKLKSRGEINGDSTEKR